ncbi:hypothetical protein [Bacilliculturomica massiliensis]|uniref:hypothetical protein n=1 Tax=Bacilliculturomica massiliensis TaxID=1917867 RepID=UPI0010316EE3|nr:hypothetical protein [Bacilliculturomica massiliensis]
MTEKKKKLDPEMESAMESEQAQYTKAQILSSRRYKGKLDLVGVLLKDGETYGIGQVDGMIDNFLKGDVR